MQKYENDENGEIENIKKHQKTSKIGGVHFRP